MEIRVICDCAYCSSRLIEIGGINILCNMPVKLLRRWKKESNSSYTCESMQQGSIDHCAILLIIRIHVIIVTSARGLEGIDILRELSDIETTHVVCTRPAYTIACLSSTLYREADVLSAIHTRCTKGKRNKHSKSFLKLYNAARNGSGTASYEERDSYHNSVNFKVGISINNEETYDIPSITCNQSPITPPEPFYPYEETNPADVTGVFKECGNSVALNEPIANDEEVVRFRAFWQDVAVCEEANSGVRLVRCRASDRNPKPSYLKDPSIAYSSYLHAISYNETVRVEVTDAGSITSPESFVLLNEAQSLLGKSAMKFKSTIELCAYSSGYSMGSSAWMIRNVESNVTIAVIGEAGYPDHDRFCTPLDTSFTRETDLVIVLDSVIPGLSPRKVKKVGDILKNHAIEKGSNHHTDLLNMLCTEAIQGLKNTEGVVVVIDPYAETLFDVLEHFHSYIQNNTKQYQNVYLYLFGEGIVELMAYADKCAEWVSPSRAELTMHPEYPSSPFSVITNMREDNRLFVGNSPDDIKDVYRYPSIVIVPYETSTLPYLKGRLYAGATVITARDRYREKLAREMDHPGIDYNLSSVDVRFQVNPETLVGCLGPKAKLIVSSKVGSSLQDVKALVGDVVTLPSGVVDGLSKSEINKSVLDTAISSFRKVADNLNVALTDVKIVDGKDLVMRDSTVDDDAGRFTFGEFKLENLLDKLERSGISSLKLSKTKGGYPIEIADEDEILIILESKGETRIETASCKKRVIITHVLDELLLSL